MAMDVENVDMNLRNRPRPHLVVLIMVLIALLAGYITFMLSFCGQLVCDLSRINSSGNISSYSVSQRRSVSRPALTASSLLKPAVAPSQISQPGRSLMKIGDTAITLELATTSAEQLQGLSGRQALPQGTGMWFVFPVPSYAPMWMKDMNFPLDIIWVDQNMTVVHIAQDLKPDTYPEIFAADGLVSYVLEVNAGFVAAHHVKIGDVVSIGQ